MRIVHALCAAALAHSLACNPSVAAEAYPAKPIHMIVPTTAGSVPDVIARLLADHLSTELHQPVIVENRPGAGGTIGLNAVAKAHADGYTLGILSLPYVIAPMVVRHALYDTERDLTPVAVAAWNYALLCVRENSPFRSVDELVAAARRQPRALRYSSQGIATPGHLAMKLLESRAGIELEHVPYKGGPAAVNALVAGDVDVHVGGLAVLAGQIKAHVLRPLATLAPHRLAAYPDLPTMDELGYTGVELRDFQGVVAPAGTPPEVISMIASSIRAIVTMPGVRARLDALGMEPSAVATSGFARLVHDETRRWHDVVQQAHITVE
jgi:tripartite-type tricarboxylate transporter receptor subunit TctC